MKSKLYVILFTILICTNSYGELESKAINQAQESNVLVFRTNGYRIIYEHGKPEDIVVVGADSNKELKSINGLLVTIVKEWEGRGLSGPVIMNNVKIFMERFKYCEFCQ